MNSQQTPLPEQDGCLWIFARNIGRVLLAVVLGILILAQSAILFDEYIFIEYGNPIELGTVDFADASNFAEQVGGYLTYDSFRETSTDSWDVINARVLTPVLTRGIGAWYLFVMPAYVIGIPIFVALVLRSGRGMMKEVWWLILPTLVGALVLTTSLDYIVLARVTEEFNIQGYDFLKDFGTGVFGGFVTGTALAFMSAVIAHYSGNS